MKPFVFLFLFFFPYFFLYIAYEKIFFAAYQYYSTSTERNLARKEVNFIVKLAIYFSSKHFHCTISAALLDRQHHNEIIEK